MERGGFIVKLPDGEQVLAHAMRVKAIHRSVYTLYYTKFVLGGEEITLFARRVARGEWISFSSQDEWGNRRLKPRQTRTLREALDWRAAEEIQ